MSDGVDGVNRQECGRAQDEEKVYDLSGCSVAYQQIGEFPRYFSSGMVDR